jgi:hypothetical protein
METRQRFTLFGRTTEQQRIPKGRITGIRLQTW